MKDGQADRRVTWQLQLVQIDSPHVMRLQENFVRLEIDKFGRAAGKNRHCYPVLRGVVLFKIAKHLREQVRVEALIAPELHFDEIQRQAWPARHVYAIDAERFLDLD